MFTTWRQNIELSAFCCCEIQRLSAFWIWSATENRADYEIHHSADYWCEHDSSMNRNGCQQYCQPNLFNINKVSSASDYFLLFFHEVCEWGLDSIRQFYHYEILIKSNVINSWIIYVVLWIKIALLFSCLLRCCCDQCSRTRATRPYFYCEPKLK